MPAPKKPLEHGTTYAYNVHKCRCDECKAAHNAAAARYRSKHGDEVNAYKRERWNAQPDEVRSEIQKAARLRRIDAARAYDRMRSVRDRDQRIEYAKVYYQLNRQKYIEKAAAWKDANPERRKELDRLAKQRAFDADPDGVRARSRERMRQDRAADPEKFRARFREWAKTPQGRLYFRAQRDARRGAPYTDEALEWIANLVDPVCTYCGEPAMSIDHIIPVSKGGTGERDNLTPACRSCNSMKRNLSLETFLARRANRWLS